MPEKAPPLWVVVLGSSVLAALISAGTNFGLEWYKTRLLLRKATAEEKRLAYAKLGEAVQQFQESLETAVISVGVARRSPKDRELQDFVSKSLDGLAGKMSAVWTAKSAPLLDATVVRDLDAILDQVALLLSASQQKGEYSGLVHEYERQMKRELGQIRLRLDSAARSVSLP